MKITKKNYKTINNLADHREIMQTVNVVIYIYITTINTISMYNSRPYTNISYILVIRIKKEEEAKTVYITKSDQTLVKAAVK